ncbi:hypothetical protein WN943_025449 [Citrus x changshan-huyou]
MLDLPRVRTKQMVLHSGLMVNCMCETKKVEELCHSLNELLIKLYGSYSFGDPNNAANTSCVVQNSEISECAGSSSLDPFAQY